MDKNDNYIYYIVKNPYDNSLKENRKIPGIFKVQDSTNGISISLTDPEEGEGPFQTIYELRRNSRIFNNIKLQKHKDRITKSKNIETLKEGLLTNVGTSFKENFIDSFSHITIGKISRKKLQGVHFYDPDKIKIIEKIKINNETGVWSARIKKQNENTNEWIEKNEITNFFPESWSVSKTFIECNYAYENKEFDFRKTYYGKTMGGIKIKFIIDQANKVITFYPEID